jgi:hypothetical protein
VRRLIILGGEREDVNDDGGGEPTLDRVVGGFPSGRGDAGGGASMWKRRLNLPQRLRKKKFQREKFGLSRSSLIGI